ncbi:MAG: type II toxin-antitoxin system RelE/ParE family toxin [Legionellales bacterium]|nr:type II toxin-antitoxin system RelE/ParE family toxin [Legionellales bacterium]
MIIRWLDEAVNDLQSLRRYIAQDNDTAAVRVVKQILHSIGLLSEQPAMGRPGRVANMRELIIANTPYIVPYRVKNNAIEILRVLHCSMKWPEDLSQ